MTNEELLAKIKAEIERRIALYSSLSENTVNLNRIDEDRQILSFISSLESENPMVLEEEISRYLREECSNDDEPSISEVARHFAQWGAEHLANARKMSPNDLEEAADEYEKKHTHQRYDGGGLTPEYDATLAEAVIFGAKWQKEQDEILKVNYEGARTVYDNTVQHLQEKIDEKYELGKKDMKEQMLKEAIEADVMLTLHDKTGDVSLHTGYLPKELGIKCDDKVRIIIVKEEN